MAGAWYREPRPLLAGGIATALLAAVAAGLVPPPAAEIAGLFSAGGYARFFTILWSLLAAAGLMIAARYIIEKKIGAGEYVSLVLYAAAGMALLSSATHLLGLFLALETFTLAFYILIACNRRCELAAEAGLKYLLMGAVATGFMAFGIALIYASSGTLALPEAVVQLYDSDGRTARLGSARLGYGVDCGWFQDFTGALPSVDTRCLPGRSCAGWRLAGHRFQGCGGRCPGRPAGDGRAGLA